MLYFLTWCWAGLIVGVSFIATPAKFLATSSSTNQLLEIGKVTFNTFMYVESIFAVLLLVSIVKINKVFATCKGLFPSVIVILVYQYAFLLPKLDERVDLLVQGGSVEPSNLHGLYVLAELLKVIVLLVLGSVIHQRAR